MKFVLVSIIMPEATNLDKISISLMSLLGLTSTLDLAQFLALLHDTP